MPLYVITGSSGSGKTSVIEELANQGYSVIHECAREIINEQKRIGGRLLPQYFPYEFEEEVARRQLIYEKNILKRCCDLDVFCDRGIYDVVGFCRYFNVEIPRIIKTKEKRYGGIFFLDMLETYEKDDVRWENKEQAIEISKMIIKAYKETGHTIYRIPAIKDVKELSIKKRVELIKSIIRSQKSQRLEHLIQVSSE